jgi:hypothetical protein
MRTGLTCGLVRPGVERPLLKSGNAVILRPVLGLLSPMIMAKVCRVRNRCTRLFLCWCSLLRFRRGRWHSGWSILCRAPRLSCKCYRGRGEESYRAKWCSRQSRAPQTLSSEVIKSSGCVQGAPCHRRPRLQSEQLTDIAHGQTEPVRHVGSVSGGTGVCSETAERTSGCENSMLVH